MALLIDILITLVLIPVSAYALKLAIERYALEDFYYFDAIKIAAVVELAVFVLQLAVVRYTEIVSTIVVIVLGIVLIRHLHKYDWHESVKIFLLWFVLRLIASILIAIIPGVIIGLR